LLHPVNFAK